MDIVVDLDQEISLEIGNFEDLEALVEMLNSTFETVQYRLEKVEGKKNMYLFIEDVLTEDDYECGIVEKRGKKAFAFSPAVHAMVMNSYDRYLDEIA